MFKKILFAVAPMMLVAGSVMADDDLLSKIAKMDTTDVKNDIAEVEETDDLGKVDVDNLLGDNEEESTEEAVAACFRRYGRSYRSNSYRSYNYGYTYNFGYTTHCAPVHTYYPSYHYTPVTYSHYSPVYTSYWGCW